MTSVYIPCLPSFFDDFSLQKLFRDFGQIKECRVIQHDTLLKSSGFVKFFNSKCAKLAASKKDQTIIERSAIRVFVIWDSKETLSTIRVSNLSKDIHVNDLQHLFSPYGDIVNVTLKKREESTEAYVSFSRVEYAIRASEEMDGAIFGPNNENLSVELANAESRYFKWKRNGFEYIRNPWPEQAISSQKPFSSPFNARSFCSNQQIPSASPQEQLYTQTPKQSRPWLSSISIPDVISNDTLANYGQISTNGIFTSSPTASVRSASSVSSQSSSSTSSNKNTLVDDTISMKISGNSSTMTGPMNNIDIPSATTETYVLPSNEVMFPPVSSVLLPQEQRIPPCGMFGLPLFLAPINSQTMVPIPVCPNNLSLLGSNLHGFPCVMPNTTPFSNIAQETASAVTNTCNVNQPSNYEKQSITQQTSLSLKKASSQASTKLLEISPSPSNCVKTNSKAAWTKEQQELGNFFYAKLEARYPERCGKLVGMLLTENKIKHKKFVNENEKAFYDKVECFNKLLDDLQQK